MTGSIRHDLRFALRLLFRRPLLTVAAALTVALGVGANTAVVSVLRTALLNPLGLHDAGRVMAVRVRLDKLNMRHVETSAVEFAEVSAMSDVFSAAAALEGRWWTYEASGEASRLRGMAVTPDFFRVFGERPALGRFFTADDRESLVLSYGFWRSSFGSDPNIVGRVLSLDGKPHRVVGVAPAGFQFPPAAEAWSPLVLSPARLARRGYNMNLTLLARLRDGVGAAQAVDRVSRHVAALKAAPAGTDLVKSGYGIELDPFAEYVVGDLRRPLLLLWIAAVVVLGAGCANVAGLLLARSAGRRREMAIRLSVGATRWHVIRQLLIESLALGALGGLGGIVMAAFATGLLTDLALPARQQQLLALVSLDRWLLLYGICLALASGLLFGLAPALQILRDSQSRILARSHRHAFHELFIVAQVAGAVVLVLTTALLLRSLWKVQEIRAGFDSSNLTTAFMTKPRNDPGFLDRVETALRSAPGVESAALSFPLPFAGGGLTSGFQIKGRTQQPGEPEWHGEAYMVSPGYFDTLRIPLFRGRKLTGADQAPGAPLAVVVDSSLAERFFPQQDPIGQYIAMYKGWGQIVGVVGTIRGTTLEEGSRPTIYYPLAQVPFFPQAVAIVRSRVHAGSIIREAIRGGSRSAPVFDIRTMNERIAESLGIRRVVALLLAVFGSISLLLAAVGIYGVIAQVVGERTQEIGIRMALGARPAHILAQFMGQGIRAGIAGLILGFLGIAYARKWMAGMLYQGSGFDVVSFAAAGAAILAILAISVWWPARRAARIDPQTALRHE